MTEMMKACIRDANGPDGLLRFGDLPKPVLVNDDKDKVLIKVKAASCNPVDYKLPNFMMKGNAMGFDVAGVVEKSTSPDFEVGDEVFGNTKNAIAEYSLCVASHVAKKPKSLTWFEAASMPLAYTTGLQALRDYAGFDIKGKKVLIIGASGGCGTAGVALAKGMGAVEVVGVCSGKNAEMVRKLGATDIVDYTKETALEKFGPSYFDVVYDCASGSGAGENYFESSTKSLKPKTGMNITLNGGPTTWIRKFIRFEATNFRLVLTDNNSAGDEMRQTLELCPDLKPIIHDPVYEFTPAGCSEGYKTLQSRRAKGKIVFNVGKCV